MNYINGYRVLTAKESREETLIKLTPEQRKEYFREMDEYSKELDLRATKEMAEKVSKARKEARFTQSELARRLGVSRQEISAIESGKRNITISKLQKIAFALGGEIEIRIIK
ncbi:MAG: helix-turn-helix transcriptional regulator [Candidatus Dojkabacteria bacterium]|nr:helix-turn-helix transcriptional regulator [Candidatus Dojkabacteria bacterium]MDQ7020480.1 helix-turn-helix transcriptional regulator [Candidatus Dojkabacteria bacterium]